MEKVAKEEIIFKHFQCQNNSEISFIRAEELFQVDNQSNLINRNLINQIWLIKVNLLFVAACALWDPETDGEIAHKFRPYSG